MNSLNYSKQADSRHRKREKGIQLFPAAEDQQQAEESEGNTRRLGNCSGLASEMVFAGGRADDGVRLEEFRTFGHPCLKVGMDLILFVSDVRFICQCCCRMKCDSECEDGDVILQIQLNGLFETTGGSSGEFENNLSGPIVKVSNLPNLSI